MQQRFIKKENNPRLLLFFAGWGSDERLFDRPVADGDSAVGLVDGRMGGGADVGRA